jgi:hypothetical protein
MKTQIGIEARNDGVIIVADQNKWYIIEIELAKHPLHEHIIPQITKFSIAYEEAKTRKKIIDTLYAEIRQDSIKATTLQTPKIEDLHKILTDLIDIQPTIAIVIDQKTPELEHICKKLPFSTQTIEFRTYTRENIGAGVHIHGFQPIFEERVVETRSLRPPITRSRERPQKLTQVLDVAQLVLGGQHLNEAFKGVAKLHDVHESTVRDKCTRQLGINTDQFRNLIQDKNRLLAILKERYPQYESLIAERLTQF